MSFIQKIIFVKFSISMYIRHKKKRPRFRSRFRFLLKLS